MYSIVGKLEMLPVVLEWGLGLGGGTEGWAGIEGCETEECGPEGWDATEGCTGRGCAGSAGTEGCVGTERCNATEGCTAMMVPMNTDDDMAD